MPNGPWLGVVPAARAAAAEAASRRDGKDGQDRGDLLGAGVTADDAQERLAWLVCWHGASLRRTSLTAARRLRRPT